MKPFVVALSLLAMTLGIATTPVQAQKTQPAYQPIRPVSSCLRSDRINEWYIVDARTALVRTGPERFEVKLQADCPRLGYPPKGLMFHSNPANQAVMPWRICGEAGETVRSRNQPPCAIQSVRRIDKAQFDQLRKRALRQGSGATQRSRP
jgi:hypothetical protein